MHCNLTIDIHKDDFGSEYNFCVSPILSWSSPIFTLKIFAECWATINDDKITSNECVFNSESNFRIIILGESSLANRIRIHEMQNIYVFVTKTIVEPKNTWNNHQNKMVYKFKFSFVTVCCITDIPTLFETGHICYI